jgi:hypothetical protein
MYLLDDDNCVVDSECSLGHFDGSPCVVIESSGGASPSRGIKRRNPDYNKLLGLLFRRLARAHNRITRVILDSSKVANLPVVERVVRVSTPYPIDLNSIDIDAFRRMLQHEVSRMHRDPEATQGGNAQKKIRVCLENSVNLDALIAKDGGEAQAIQELFAPNLTETQRSYLRSARVGQGQFRKNLIHKYNSTCPLTGITHDQLLIASHIKPWKVCTNSERLDPSNGILLSALADRLFDKGLVSFLADGSALVSQRMSVSDRSRCGVDGWQKVKLDARSAAYMEYHRTEQFKKT